VEVHDAHEIERALKVGARLIGINNRDLRTFEVDLGLTARLIPYLPSDVTIVAESGIQTTADVRQMAALGVHAILVGESLVKSSKLAATVRAFSTVAR
jgi:indole-3-glycerol phosphate synthase